MKRSIVVMFISIIAAFSLLFSVGAVPPKSSDSAESIKKQINSGSKDLSRKILKNLKLNDIDLQGAAFTQSDLSNSDLSGLNLTQCDFSKANLTNTDLTGADLTGVKFVGATLVGTKMLHLKGLQGANFSTATISNVSISIPASQDAAGVGALFDRAKINNFMIYTLNNQGTLSLIKGSASFSKSTISFRINNLDLRSAKLGGMTFSKCYAINCNFTGSDFKGAYIVETTFLNCDFTRCNLDNLNFYSHTTGIKSYFAGSKISVKYAPILRGSPYIADYDQIVWVN
jgi:uncharacterized protein YjbI with pentapeptide repeats